LDMQNSHLLSSSSVVHPKCKVKQELLYVLSAQLKLGGSTIIVSDVCVDDPLRIRSRSLVSKLPAGLWEMSASLRAQPKESAPAMILWGRVVEVGATMVVA
jgi:uncharacterized glyoxalase superfamily protein PhnB